MADSCLGDVQVLEYSRFVSGPFCAKVLADLGAEVIKIETPGIGDEARRRGPFLNDIPDPETSGLFLYLNTNKMGITLNLETATGREIFNRLIKQADILVEDLQPGAAARLGLQYESLREINPGLIVTSITPFGRSGPYRDYKAYDLNVSHGGGLGNLMPPLSPNLKRAPVRAGGFYADVSSGLTAAVATVAALLAREATGLGQHVDVSRQETITALVTVELARYLYGGISWSRVPDRTPLMARLRCHDGWVIPVAFEDHHWQAFAEFLGNPPWATGEKAKDRTQRMIHAEELNSLLAEAMAPHTREEIQRLGLAKGFPIGPIKTPEEVVHSEHLRARGFFAEVEHPKAGKLDYPTAPYHFSQTPLRLERPAPLLGQHNEEVYCQRLGYSKLALVKLRESGII